MKLIYIVFRIVSVFDSQVLSLLNHYANHEPNLKKIYLIVGIRSKKERILLKKKHIHNNITILFYYNFSSFYFLKNLTKFSLKLRMKTIKIDSSTIIHCRGERLGYYVSQIFDKKKLDTKNYLIDIRGTSIEEINEFLNFPSFLKRSKIKLAEKAIHNLNDEMAISTVTNSLRNYIIQKNQKKNLKIYVTPCLVYEKFKFCKHSRLEVRNNLNLSNNDIVFVFATGSNKKWQNIEQTLNIIADKGYKIINLSKTKLSNKNIINKFVTYKEVYKYLSASDIAVIWRDQSIVNKVALPVKFCEYICCGLPVITNNNIDSITKIIREDNLGIILNKLDEINNKMLKTLLLLNRNDISIKGHQYFNIRNISKKYFKIYLNIIQKQKFNNN